MKKSRNPLAPHAHPTPRPHPPAPCTTRTLHSTLHPGLGTPAPAPCTLHLARLHPSSAVTDDEKTEILRLLEAHERTLAVCRACAETTRDLAWEVTRGGTPAAGRSRRDARGGRTCPRRRRSGGNRHRSDEGGLVVIDPLFQAYLAQFETRPGCGRLIACRARSIRSIGRRRARGSTSIRCGSSRR